MPWAQLGHQISELFAARTGLPLDGLLAGGRALPDEQLTQLRKKLDGVNAAATAAAAQNGNGAAATSGAGVAVGTSPKLGGGKGRSQSNSQAQATFSNSSFTLEQKPLEEQHVTDQTFVSFQKFARPAGKIRVKMHKIKAEQRDEEPADGGGGGAKTKQPTFLDYTLWEYVFSALRLLTECEFHRKLWTEGLIYGFLSHKQAKQMLEETRSPPMVIVRFSDNQPGAITCTGYYCPSSAMRRPSAAGSTSTLLTDAGSAFDRDTLSPTGSSVSTLGGRPIVEALEPWDLKALEQLSLKERLCSPAVGLTFLLRAPTGDKSRQEPRAIIVNTIESIERVYMQTKQPPKPAKGHAAAKGAKGKSKAAQAAAAASGGEQNEPADGDDDDDYGYRLAALRIDGFDWHQHQPPQQLQQQLQHQFPLMHSQSLTSTIAPSGPQSPYSFTAQSPFSAVSSPAPPPMSDPTSTAAAIGAGGQWLNGTNCTYASQLDMVGLSEAALEAILDPEFANSLASGIYPASSTAAPPIAPTNGNTFYQQILQQQLPQPQPQQQQQLPLGAFAYGSNCNSNANSLLQFPGLGVGAGLGAGVSIGAGGWENSGRFWQQRFEAGAELIPNVPKVVHIGAAATAAAHYALS